MLNWQPYGGDTIAKGQSISWVIERPYAPHAVAKVSVQPFRAAEKIPHAALMCLLEEGRHWDYTRAYQRSTLLPYEIGLTKTEDLGQFIAEQLENAIVSLPPSEILAAAGFSSKRRGVYEQVKGRNRYKISISRIGVTLTSQPARGGRTTMLAHLSLAQYAPALPGGRLPNIWSPHIKSPLRAALAAVTELVARCDR